MTIENEFPDFPLADLPSIPDGFVDNSWHNDTMPHFDHEVLRLSIWIDYLDPNQREGGPGGTRFSVYTIDDVGAFTGTVLMTDEWSDVLSAIDQFRDAPSNNQESKMKPLTWLEVAGLPEGTRVQFVEQLDIFPEALIPAGSMATIVENGLNEIWCAMLVKPDDEKLCAALSAWQGRIYLPPTGTSLDPGADNAASDPAWNSASPLALVSMEDRLQASDNKFFDWFSSTVKTASDTEVGKLAIAAGYSVAHTGGGCLCWEHNLSDATYLWICDEGNGLGDSLAETYLVGFYSEDGEVIDDGSVENFAAALAWCDKHIKKHQAKCQHRDTGRGVCADCGAFLTEDQTQIGERQALIEIARTLDLQEWDSETMESVADIVRRAGFPIRDPNDQ